MRNGSPLSGGDPFCRVRARYGRHTAAAIAVAVVLMLSGCVVASPRPAGLTEQQQHEFALQAQARQWMYAEIPHREQPVVAPTFVAPADVDRLVFECLVDAGLGDVYALEQGGLVSFGSLKTPDEHVAYYICSVRYWASPRYWGYLSTEELDWAYDYYQDWLVPCLEARGYELPLAPRRAEVTATPGYLAWNPYSQLGARITDEKIKELEYECPYYPPGLY
jgi:hypothetical protein